MSIHDNHSSHTEISTDRLEAFSDAVMAIIITIGVLTIRIPDSPTFASIKSALPTLLVYAISFQNIGTYWNNHHHLLRATKHLSTAIMWANLFLLFCLSLIPVATAWLGNHYQSQWPTAFYIFVLIISGIAYLILQLNVIRHSEKKEGLMEEFRQKPKGLISMSMYVVALILAFFNPFISDLLVIIVALMWFIPDRRIEKYIGG